MIHNLLLLIFISGLLGWWLWRKSKLNSIQIGIILPIASIIFLLALFLSISLQNYHRRLPSFLLSSGIEESSRAMIFFLITPLLHRQFQTHLERLKLALVVGFIFAILENFGYILSLPFFFFLVRTMIISPLHIFLSMIQIHYRWVGFFIAWLIHALYNFTSESSFVLMLIIQGITPFLWIYIILWLQKYQQKPFSAF